MQERLKQILEESKKRLQEAASVQEAEEVRIKVLGKKGQLTEILRSMGQLDPEQRKELGLAANQVRADIEKMLDATFEQLKSKAREAKFKEEKIDVTEPGKIYKLGTKHPVTITIEEISRVFKSMGFTLTEGPEVETVFNNFDALNAGPNHPAGTGRLRRHSAGLPAGRRAAGSPALPGELRLREHPLSGIPGGAGHCPAASGF